MAGDNHAVSLLTVFDSVVIGSLKNLELKCVIREQSKWSVKSQSVTHTQTHAHCVLPFSPNSPFDPSIMLHLCLSLLVAD